MNREQSEIDEPVTDRGQVQASHNSDQAHDGLSTDNTSQPCSSRSSLHNREARDSREDLAAGVQVCTAGQHGAVASHAAAVQDDKTGSTRQPSRSSPSRHS